MPSFNQLPWTRFAGPGLAIFTLVLSANCGGQSFEGDVEGADAGADPERRHEGQPRLRHVHLRTLGRRQRWSRRRRWPRRR
jgi:hypothetical protein